VLFNQAQLADIIAGTKQERLYLAPSSIDLSAADMLIPPVPPRKQHWPLILFCVVGAVMLVGMLIVGGIVLGFSLNIGRQQAAIAQQSTIAVSPTDTPDPNYKADDLLAHIILGDAQILRFNDSIYEWTFNTYQVTVQASSSMDFVDHTLIPEIGIWVYDSRALTAQAASQVYADEVKDGPAGLLGKPSIYMHGRCLMLGADSSEDAVDYVLVVTQYCV
jgi:hypothetical protein